jgi:hypothetical protein
MAGHRIRGRGTEYGRLHEIIKDNQLFYLLSYFFIRVFYKTFYGQDKGVKGSVFEIACPAARHLRGGAL